MRTTVAVTAAISVLFVGVWAIGQQASTVQPKLNSSAANASYDAATGVFETVGGPGGSGIVWFGVGAIVIAAMGFLVVASRGGGR